DVKVSPFRDMIMPLASALSPLAAKTDTDASKHPATRLARIAIRHLCIFPPSYVSGPVGNPACSGECALKMCRNFVLKPNKIEPQSSRRGITNELSFLSVQLSRRAS